MEDERREVIAGIAVLFGLFRGLAGKNDPRSMNYRAEYKKKLYTELERAEELGVRGDPEIKRIEARIVFYDSHVS